MKARIVRVRILCKSLLLATVVSCSSAPTAIPVTLTAPASTETPQPFLLVPAVQLGASFEYSDGTSIVSVPHGEFLMGHGNAEDPGHEVILSDYWIYATEVTNSQYSLCVAQGWCSLPDSADNPAYETFDGNHLPVVGVSHEQARTYCQFMGGDLATEAQWEKAARTADGSQYPWGNSEPSCELANYGKCAKHAEAAYLHAKGRSAYGALNMAGNVYEWVADWFDPLYYEASPAGDPAGPFQGRARVIRSSGYRSTADQLVSYARSYADPDDHRPDLGFRCAISQPAVHAPACRLAPVVPEARTAGITAACPQLSIEVDVTACRFGGGAVVTFNNELERDPNASFGGIVGCTLLAGSPGVYPISYACRRPSVAVMTTRCDYAGVPTGECRPGYILDPTSMLCQWSGARTQGIECPAGEFYDPVSHCCSVTSGDQSEFPVCPVGSTFTETARGIYACLPAEFVRPPPAVSESVSPPVCGQLCELTVELCAIRTLVFCPTTCACLAVGRQCPEP